MESPKLHGAKNALSSMLFYYMYALKEEGYADPKQVASEEIGKMISLADEQAHLIAEDVKVKGKLSESVGLAVQLLTNMEDSKQYDAESIEIIKGVLMSVSESFDKREVTEDDVRQHET